MLSQPRMTDLGGGAPGPGEAAGPPGPARGAGHSSSGTDPLALNSPGNTLAKDQSEI